MVTGIVKGKDLLEYSNKNFKSVVYKKFNDHHMYSLEDVNNIINIYNKINSNSKIILTTEKDFMKLNEFHILKNKTFYLPIQIKINKQKKFIKQIINIC